MFVGDVILLSRVLRASSQLVVLKRVACLRFPGLLTDFKLP